MYIGFKKWTASYNGGSGRGLFNVQGTVELASGDYNVFLEKHKAQETPSVLELNLIVERTSSRTPNIVEIEGWPVALAKRGNYSAVTQVKIHCDGIAGFTIDTIQATA